MRYLLLLLLLVGCAQNENLDQDPNHIIYFGDSFTALPGYPQEISKATNTEEVNYAKGGSMVSYTLPLIMDWGVTRNTISIWLVGYNDERCYGMNPVELSNYESGLRLGIDHLTLNGARLLLGNTIPMMESSYKIGSYVHGSDEAVRAHNEINARLVNEFKNKGRFVSLVDISSHYDPYTMTGPDLVHPNEIGFKYIADQFLKELE